LTTNAGDLSRNAKKREKKNPNGESHRTAAKRAKKALRIAKKKWFTDLLKETEEAQGRGDYKTLYDNIIKVSRKKTTKPGIGIKYQDGTMLYKIEDIKKRWKNYCSELFGRVGHTPENIEKGEEPEILEIEIEAAVKKLRKGKSVGLDEIPAEALKAGGKTVIKAMKKIIDDIWRTGKWPAEWVISELVLLPKVSGTQDCTKYRTVSLISHASKILLEILQQRLQYYRAPEIAEERFGQRNH